MMLRHTKGPWWAKKLATYQEPGFVILWPDKEGTHMRRLDYQGNFTEADARLIAQAPELLRLALRILEHKGDARAVLPDLRVAVARAIEDDEIINDKKG